METGPTILLVEDDPHDIELTLAALNELALADRVVAVKDGADALDYLFSRGAFAQRAVGLPAVVILDIKMSKVSGLEVLRQMRSEPRLSTLPVVMLTSSRMEADVTESYRMGANAYVVKPVEFAAFVEAVTTLAHFWGRVNEPPPAFSEQRRECTGDGGAHEVT